MPRLIVDKSAVVTVRFLPRTFYNGNALPRMLKGPIFGKAERD